MICRLLTYLLLFTALINKAYGDDINTSAVVKNDETCGNRNGSITGIIGPLNYTYRWVDIAGNTRGNKIDLTNVAAGSYTLFYTDPATGISNTYGPIALKNVESIIDKTNNDIQPSSCGASTGSVTNINLLGTITSIVWTKDDDLNLVLPNTKDLINAFAGKYTLTVGNSTGCYSTASFVIPESTDIVIAAADVVITKSDCRAATGSITNVVPRGDYPLKYSWRNQDETEVATTPNLNSQPAGLYTLYVTGGAAGACIKTYGPVAIGTTSSLVIDTSKFVKVAGNCLPTGGSIRNINVVGSVGNAVYTWYRYNSDGPAVQVGNALELRSVPAGSYYLRVADDSGCGPVYSEVYQLRDASEFVFYPELIKVTTASCEAYASVTGISEQQYLTGRLDYEWRDSLNSKVLSTEANFTNIPGGKFFLNVRSRCDTEFRLMFGFNLGQDYTTYPAKYRYTLRNTCVNQATGSITLDAYPGTVQRFRWVKNNTDFGFGPALKNIGPGDYTLYVTDELGCERYYDVFTVFDTTPVQILDKSGELSADTCNTSTGSIKNVQLVNGYPPFTYTWRNSADKVVSQSADALNLSVGEYTLTVSDATNCEGPSKSFILQNVDVIPPAPPINNIYICSSGEAVFRVINPNPNSSYRLYETESAYNAIDEQVSGEFKPKVITERKFYVSRVRGDCEGPRTEVDIKIGMIITDVTNTFTPNGDGVNDYWKINNVEKYTDALVQVFNRSGQMIFQSRGYAQPFNGTYNGKLLPSGVYYYVVTLDNGCRVSGNVTILR